MSLEKTARGEWRVRWREGGRNRAKVIGSRADALLFESELRRRKRMGDLASLDAGRELVGDFAQEWFVQFSAIHHAKSTRRAYARIWDAHLLDRVGDLALRDLTPEICERLAADLARAGIGPAARRKALMLLQSILSRAEAWGRIRGNPMRGVRKPSQRRQREIAPLPPSAVEAIRADLNGRGHHWDATLVSVLAYGGLRPGEARALRWNALGDQTLRVERAADDDGLIKPTKTERRRTVRLLAPLKVDLAEWRLRLGRPDPSSLVFPRADGGVLVLHDWQNWRRRTFDPAAERHGWPDAVPYDLRHSYVSLLVQQGSTAVDVGRQAGHSPKLTWDTYSHIFEEFDGLEPCAAEDLIWAARGPDVPTSYLAREAGE